MTSALARYLTDFDAAGQKTMASGSAGPSVRVEAPIDIEAERARAREEGYRAAREALAGEHATALDALRQRNGKEIAALRQRLEDDAARTMDARFAALRDELAETIGQAAAGVLAPFLDEALARRMVGQLAEAIGAALGDAQVARLTVTGPAGLFGRLAALPSMAGRDLRHVEAEGVDLSVDIDAGILATRLAAFRDGLAETLA